MELSRRSLESLFTHVPSRQRPKFAAKDAPQSVPPTSNKWEKWRRAEPGVHIAGGRNKSADSVSDEHMLGTRLRAIAAMMHSKTFRPSKKALPVSQRRRMQRHVMASKQNRSRLEENRAAAMATSPVESVAPSDLFANANQPLTAETVSSSNANARGQIDEE